MADSPPERETAHARREAPRRGASRGRYADDRGRYSDDRDYVSGSADVARDLTRLAFAWTQAGAHALFDTVGVVNNLAADVTDSVIDSLAPSRTDDRDGDEDGDEDDRRSSRARRGRSASARRSSRRGPPVLDQVNSSVSRAIRDAADVISRTADDFTRAYDEEVGDDDNDDDDAAEGRHGAKRAGTRSVKVEASASKS
uniref:Uncharacterized protein n=1 Tax=Caulobacter sp. (strain K31) TaxID=366602 RepID=B0SZY9_CAUSK